MAELGQTSEPTQLVPGAPGEIRKSTVHLVTYGDTMLKIGDGLKKLDTGGWAGQAADAFHARFHDEPQRWLDAGDAFHGAATAINAYADTLAWAQDQAAQALGLWQQGEQATTRAKAEHDQAMAAATQQAAGGGQSSPALAPFQDPGEGLRQQARELLARARSQVDSAGQQAVGAVDRAQEHAPAEPTLLDEIGDTFISAADWAGEQVADGLDSAGHAVGKLADDVGKTAAAAVHDVTATAGVLVDDVGRTAGAALHDLGTVTGLEGVAHAGGTVSSALHEADRAITDAGTAAGHAIQDVLDDAGTTISGWVDDIVGAQTPPKGPQYVIVDQGDYPEAADHVREAQTGTSWRGDMPYARTQPMEVTIDRDGAEARREESMKQVPQTRSGSDRDEYPPAMFSEGGEGSSVKYIDPFDNRGAGSSLRHQTASLGNGEKVIILAD